MFEFIRNHQKLMQFILLIFIAPAFVLLGVSGYDTASNANALAVVGDHPITQEEFDNVKRNQIERARLQAQGQAFDASQFDTPQANRQLLDSIITQYLLAEAANKQFLTASDAALQKRISQSEMFQKDGRFDYDTYKSELAARGVSEKQYEQNVKAGLAQAQVLEPVLEAAFLTPLLKEQVDAAQLSGRQVRVRTVGLGVFTESVQQPAAEELKAWYEANLQAYMQPEQVNVEYVVLSPEQVKNQIEVLQTDIEAYYVQNKARFSTVEERKARHILLGKDVAEEEAQRILNEVKNNPNQFAELAARYSTDTGSKNQGGDLGYFRKGAMVPEFELAVFALKKGETSGLVKSAFGTHIIQLTDIRGGEAQPLSAVQNPIIDEIRAQKLTLRMAQEQQEFSEKVFEGGRSFESVVKPLNLEVQQQAGLTRQGLPGNEVLSSADVLNEIFSADSLKNRNNTKAITVGNKLVSARVTAYRTATPKPFEEVQAQVRAQLVQTKARQAALAKAKQIADALGASNNTSKDAPPQPAESVLQEFDAQKVVSALDANGLPPAVLQAVLGTPAAMLPKADVVDVGTQGYVVAWVQGVAPVAQVREKAEPGLLSFYESINQRAYQEALALASREALAKRIKVEVHKNFGAQPVAAQ
ncbi:MAG: hypothetical protein HC848_00970 [Limnobacter sp.]|nr:hypothetical protein [Limnobacter sp.]